MKKLSGHLSAYVILMSALTNDAMSQNLPKVDINPPQLNVGTVSNVSLLSGWPVLSQPTVSIGGDSGGIAHHLIIERDAILAGFIKDPYMGTVEKVISPACGYAPPDCGHYSATFGSRTELFIESTGGFVPITRSGSTLVRDGATGGFVYTTGDGTRYIADLSTITGQVLSGGQSDYARISKVVKPDGRIYTIRYQSATYVRADGVAFPQSRIASVESNSGYRLLYYYGANGVPDESTLSLWNRPTAVAAYNMAVDYCGVDFTGCSFSRSWPTASFIRNPLSPPAGLSGLTTFELAVVDAAGGTAKFLNEKFPDDEWRLTSVKAASSAGAYTSKFEYDSYIYCAMDGEGSGSCYRVRPQLVLTASDENGKTTFSYQKIPGPAASIGNPEHPILSRWVARATSATGRSNNVVYSSAARGGIESVSNGMTPLGTNAIEYTNNLVSKVTELDGRVFTYDYDTRGNVVERRQLHATDSTKDLIASAGYDAVCLYPVKCNKPNWVRDARGYQVDYVYDSVHGGLLKETWPADSTGVRPEIRYVYAQRYAWLKNSSGTYSKAGTSVWLLTETSSCVKGAPAVTSAGCSLGAADEVKTLFEYGPDSGPNNLRLKGKVVTADGVSQRFCYSYDALGNKISETTPNAGIASCP